VYAEGHRRTHYLGLDGCMLHTLAEDGREFKNKFQPLPVKKPVDFANAYTGTEDARRMIPISGAAYRVLRSILVGQATGLDDIPQLAEMEQHMADAPKRNPDGPVAQIHAFLDKRLDAIKAQRTSRKDLVDQLVGKGLNQSTVVTQCGAWARINGVTFARPAQAAEAKKATRVKKVAVAA
jgi:hypothetical protein